VREEASPWTNVLVYLSHLSRCEALSASGCLLALLHVLETDGERLQRSLQRSDTLDQRGLVIEGGTVGSVGEGGARNCLLGLLRGLGLRSRRRRTRRGGSRGSWSSTLAARLDESVNELLDVDDGAGFELELGATLR